MPSTAHVIRRRMGAAVRSVVDAVLRWYHEQACTLKKGSKNKQWALQQLQGDFWIPIRGIFSVLTDPATLQRMGFSIQMHDGNYDAERDPELYDDASLALQVGRLCQSLTRRRTFRSAWFMQGYPSRFTLLLEPGLRDGILAEIKAVDVAYQRASEMHTELMHDIVMRSPFRLVCNHQIVEPLRAHGWRTTPMLLECLAQRASCFKQSRIIENGFLKERRKETGHTNFEMSAVTIMAALINSDVLAGRFEYHTHDIDLQHDECSSLPQEAFEANTRDTSISLEGLRTTERTPKFLTHTPATWVRHHLEPMLLRHLLQSDKWEEADKLFLTNLLPNTEPVLLRRKGEGDAAWVLVLGIQRSTAVMAWPVVRAHEEELLFQPACGVDDTPVYLHVHSIDWELLRCTWAPPRQQLGKPALRHLHGSKAGIRLLATGPPMNLVHAAALSAFWHCSEGDLRFMAALPELGLKDALVEHEFATFLEVIIRKLHPDLSHTDIYCILHKRVAENKRALDDALDLDDVREFLTPDDREALDKEESAEKQQFKKSRQHFLNSLKPLREKVKEEQQRLEEALMTEVRKKGPVEYRGSAESWTQEMVQQWAPPQGRVLKDFFNKRWRVTHLFGNVSRSWGLHGHYHSLVIALQLAWEAHTSNTGLECKIPGIAAEGARSSGTEAPPEDKGKGARRGRAKGRGKGSRGARGKGARGGVGPDISAPTAPAPSSISSSDSSSSNSDA